ENRQAILDSLIEQVSRENLSEELPRPAHLVSCKGRSTPVEGAVSAIFDLHGEFLGSVVVLRDISARRELESLQRTTEQRQYTALKLQAVGRLAGGLAQNLNNLLTAVLGNTSLTLTSLPERAEGQQLLQKVELAAQRAAQLVQRLQIFSHFSSQPRNQHH